MSGQDIQISGPDGDFSGYLALPAQTPAPAVVLLQEIFGVNADMRAKCDALAKEGYVAFCPDLFWRIEPGIQLTDKTEAEWARAFELFNAFNVDTGMKDIDASIEAIRGHEACSGKVGTIGYCLGGQLAYLSATRTGSDASVGYYGVAIANRLDEAKSISKPLMLHIAGKDEFVPADQQAAMHEGLDDHPMTQLHDYPDMDHAFARTDGTHYDRDNAVLADGRTMSFLAQHLRF